MVIQPPPFRCTVIRTPERARIRVEGDVDVATAEAIDTELRRLHEEGVNGAVLDLEAVSFMDSTGVRLLVRWAQVADVSGWELRLALGSRAVETVLRLAGVRDLLPVEEAAS